MSENEILSNPVTDTPPPPLSSDGLREWMRSVLDPDIGVSLVDMGLIYEVNISAPPAELSQEGADVKVLMTLTSPMCPSGGYLKSEIKKRLEEHPEVKAAEVDVTFEPKWDPKIMASEEVKDMLGIW
jgi:metal-sulfur cluster biosynthetic enzyme